MKKGSDPSSRVWKQTIAETCGACHPSEQAVFQESIHGKAVAAGVMSSPSCTDCHGEHEIFSPKDERARVSSTRLSAEVCSPCHASVRLTEKYGIASGRFETFRDSYHGLAGRAGSVEVANCASCHGYHDIKPSSDPTSRIHKANLVATCGTCHPGANENFARGSVHVVGDTKESEVLLFVSTFYIVLIVGIVGMMLVHNSLDFLKCGRLKLRERRGKRTYDEIPHRLYLRMSLNERLQHGALIITFFTLVVTGFMLKFPDAWWVVPIREMSPAVFEIRSLLHRSAGVGLILAGMYHLYYIFRVPRGRQLIHDLLPVRSDFTGAMNMLKYNLGLSKERPRFGRFSYIEKSEYWALVWGTVIMGVTGVILWFENTFLGLLTKLWWDVSEAIHYYEAWLATLAIIVWHFYYVIFSPRVYPMNVSWLKGTITEEEMMEDHPVELEEIKARESEESESTEESDRDEVEKTPTALVERKENSQG
jgi:cytochrome b subunit of formate dehydrogenase